MTGSDLKIYNGKTKQEWVKNKYQNVNSKYVFIQSLYDSVLLNMKTSKGENTFNKYLNTETSNLCILWWFVIYVETSPVASEL